MVLTVKDGYKNSVKNVAKFAVIKDYFPFKHLLSREHIK
jgi:hypothetical protein